MDYTASIQAVYEWTVSDTINFSWASAWVCDTVVIQTVSIEAQSSSEIVEIYPNPANNQITISSSVKISEITIFDQLGNLLLFIDGLQSQKELLDISMLNSGVYILKLKIGKGIVNKRIVKM